MRKPIRDLTEEDLARHPVWNYFEDRMGNILASAVRRTPVDSLGGRLVGCPVTFRNGQKHWARLSNIDLKHERATSQFLVLSILRGGRWFDLARYFDVDYEQRGPAALSQFLGLPVREIFPISYDIAPYVTGAAIPSSGLILQEPRERLSQDDLIKLSLA